MKKTEIDYEKGSIPLPRPEDEEFVMLYLQTGNALQSHKDAYKNDDVAHHVRACQKLKTPKYRNRIFYLQREMRENSFLNSDARLNMMEAALRASFFSAINLETGEVKDIKAFKSFLDSQQMFARLSGEWDEKLTVTQNVAETTVKYVSDADLEKMKKLVDEGF